MREEEEGQKANARGDRQFPDEDQKVTDFVDHQQSKRIGNDQTKGSTSRSEEARAVDRGDDVRIAIEELQELLQTEQTAATTAEQTARETTGFLFHFLLEVFQNQANELDDGDEQRAKGQRAEMEDQRAKKRTSQRGTWNSDTTPIPIVSSVDTS